MTVRPANEASAESAGWVVVGVHESASSVAALTWALQVAVDRGWHVQVVTAWPDADVTWIHEVPGHYCEARARAEAAQQAALRAALREVQQAPTPSARVTNEAPAEALVTASQWASLVVVGGQDRRAAEHRGSLGREVARRVRCPVVVVPDEGPRRRKRPDPRR